MTVLDSAEIELGVGVDPMAYYVDPDEVLAFASAINDDSPRYLRDAAAPPTYSVVPASPAVRAMPGYSPSVVAATRALVHGEHDMVIHRPIVPGTWVHTSVQRIGVVPSRAGLSIEQLVRTFNDDGDLLVEHHWVPMLIGTATGDPRGTPPPDHTFPEAVRGGVVSRTNGITTRDQTFRYAGASSDRSEIHVNDEAARKRGFPKKFNQGLCTFGISVRMLVDLVAGGEPGQVRRVAVRFSAPAYPGDDIELAVFEIDEGSWAFEATAGGQLVLRHGRIELQPSAH